MGQERHILENVKTGKEFEVHSKLEGKSQMLLGRMIGSDACFTQTALASKGKSTCWVVRMEARS